MDKFVKYIIKYNKDLDPVIDQVFDRDKKRLSQIAPVVEQFADDYKHFLKGGKKLRGSEIFLGYKMFGGKSKKMGLMASLVIEIVHSFLLIHDDFMDGDALRRGEPTMHKKYAKKYGDHFGESMAIDIGDEGCFLAFKLLNSLKLPRERLSKATQFFSDLLLEVGAGQALDLMYEEEKNLLEETVLRIHRYKTAGYTISGPLSIGALLAGASKKVLKPLEKFGIPVGVAFQIRDDELGMFSTEEQLGKPVDSDLKEGKITLLMVKALELARGDDKKFLKYAHGNQHLTLKEVERARQIIKDTGAYNYSHNKGRQLVEEGNKFIPQITKNKKDQEILGLLADFMIERKS